MEMGWVKNFQFKITYNNIILAILWEAEKTVLSTLFALLLTAMELKNHTMFYWHK